LVLLEGQRRKLAAAATAIGYFPSVKLLIVCPLLNW
jgi:hypothetical protein